MAPLGVAKSIITLAGGEPPYEGNTTSADLLCHLNKYYFGMLMLGLVFAFKLRCPMLSDAELSRSKNHYLIECISLS